MRAYVVELLDRGQVQEQKVVYGADPVDAMKKFKTLTKQDPLDFIGDSGKKLVASVYSGAVTPA